VLVTGERTDASLDDGWVADIGTTLAVAVLIPYQERPEGSASKLRTSRDGVRILRTIANLVRDQRPLMFFSATGVVAILVGLLIGLPVVGEFMQTGLVPRLPSAVLAVAFVLLGFLSLICGLILDSVARGRKEAKRLAYLSVRANAPFR
jgi:hypothetical protein